MRHHTPALAALALTLVSLAVHMGTADAADGTDAAAAKAVLAQDRANCEAGKTSQDRATCLKEAAAAAQERRRNGLENTGSARSNALARCKTLPVPDQADCRARIEGTTAPNQTVTTTGSVAGGGVLRETRTTTIGPAVVLPAASQPAASAPR